jgi:RNA polymerase-binding transcription factor DksA
MNTEHFKGKLEEEQALLTKQLGDIAAEDPVTGLWTPKAPEMDVMPPQAEPNEAADKIEELDERGEEVTTLSARLADVRKALENIEEGNYGRCEVCNKEIEQERLEANPAARTCTAHL